MKILITGGSGFIGTNLIDYYLIKGVDLLNIDIAAPRKKEHNFYWKKVDVREYAELEKAINDFQPTYVIHLAARADQRGETIQDYDTNILGVRNVMNACNCCKSINKVIFTSTMLVCRVGYYPLNDTDYCPPNLYGESKMNGEMIVRENAHLLNYKWVIVRPTSIWGPWFGPTYRDFFIMIIDKKFINFSGKTSDKVYGFIENTIYQIDAILFSDLANFCMYYLGDYKPTNIKVWANEIASLMGIRLYTVPNFLIYFAAIIGDVFKKIKVKFPMNSFRYKNMTTNNLLPLDKTKIVAPDLPVCRDYGNKVTLEWLKSYFLKQY